MPVDTLKQFPCIFHNLSRKALQRGLKSLVNYCREIHLAICVVVNNNDVIFKFELKVSYVTTY